MRNLLRDTPTTSPTSDERVGTDRKDERSKVYHPTELFLLVAVFLLGTNPVAVKYAVSAFAPLPFVALRFTVAGLLLLGAVRFFLGSGGIERKDLLALGGVGALGVGANTMLYGGLAALPFALPGFLSVEWDAMSVGGWAAVTYSTVLVAAIGFFAWQRGASLLGANKVLVYQYLITFVGVFSGIVFLGEGLGIDKIVGGAIILFGVYLARRQKCEPLAVLHPTSRRDKERGAGF